MNHFFQHYLAIEILLRDFEIFLIVLGAIKPSNSERYEVGRGV